jgi:hypothetical protein
VTVRREALQLAVQIEAEREEAITLALNDDDERAMRIGVNAAREHGLPTAAVNVLLKRIEDTELSPDIVATLLRLVSRERSPAVVDVLLSFVLHSRRLLGGARLAPRSPEMLAALSSLTHMPADDPRTRTALELARASTDDAVREAARVRST